MAGCKLNSDCPHAPRKCYANCKAHTWRFPSLRWCLLRTGDTRHFQMVRTCQQNIDCIQLRPKFASCCLQGTGCKNDCHAKKNILDDNFYIVHRERQKSQHRKPHMPSMSLCVGGSGAQQAEALPENHQGTCPEHRFVGTTGQTHWKMLQRKCRNHFRHPKHHPQLWRRGHQRTPLCQRRPGSWAWGTGRSDGWCQGRVAWKPCSGMPRNLNNLPSPGPCHRNISQKLGTFRFHCKAWGGTQKFWSKKITEFSWPSRILTTSRSPSPSQSPIVMWPQVPTSKEVERSCEAKQELSQTNRSPLFEQDAKYGPASQWVARLLPARHLLTERTARPRLLTHELCLADFVNLTISRPPSPSQSKTFHDKSDEKSGSWVHGKRGCPVRSTRVPLTCSR